MLTPEGQRLRDQFWHNLVTDAGPLTPLREPDLRALAQLLAQLDQPAATPDLAAIPARVSPSA